MRRCSIPRLLVIGAIIAVIAYFGGAEIDSIVHWLAVIGLL
jgi:hypothetical protein